MLTGSHITRLTHQVDLDQADNDPGCSQLHSIPPRCLEHIAYSGSEHMSFETGHAFC